MGASYSAETYVGVEVFRQDFIETTRTFVEEAVCVHPEARDYAFCPVCGTPRSKRMKTTEEISESWRPKIAPLLDPKTRAAGPSRWEDYLSDSTGSIGGLKILRICRCNEGEVTLLLGMKLAEEDESNREWPRTDLKIVQDIVLTPLQRILDETGLDRPICFHTVLYVSI